MITITNQTEDDEETKGGLVVLVALVEAIFAGPDDRADVPAEAAAVEDEVGENSPGDELDGSDDADDAFKKSSPGLYHHKYRSSFNNNSKRHRKNFSPAAILRIPATMQKAMPVLEMVWRFHQAGEK